MSIKKACNFIKNETLTQVFSCEFWEVLKNIPLFKKHLWWLLLRLENTGLKTMIKTLEQVHAEAYLARYQTSMKEIFRADNKTHRGKLYLVEELIKVRSWLLLIFSICLRNQLKFHYNCKVL